MIKSTSSSWSDSCKQKTVETGKLFVRDLKFPGLWCKTGDCPSGEKERERRQTLNEKKDGRKEDVSCVGTDRNWMNDKEL